MYKITMMVSVHPPISSAVGALLSGSNKSCFQNGAICLVRLL